MSHFLEIPGFLLPRVGLQPGLEWAGASAGEERLRAAEPGPEVGQIANTVDG